MDTGERDASDEDLAAAAEDDLDEDGNGMKMEMDRRFCALQSYRMYLKNNDLDHLSRKRAVTLV